MKKYITTFLLLLTLIIPSLTHAQVFTNPTTSKPTIEQLTAQLHTLMNMLLALQAQQKTVVPVVNNYPTQTYIGSDGVSFSYKYKEQLRAVPILATSTTQIISKSFSFKNKAGVEALQLSYLTPLQKSGFDLGLLVMQMANGQKNTYGETLTFSLQSPIVGQTDTTDFRLLGIGVENSTGYQSGGMIVTRDVPLVTDSTKKNMIVFSVGYGDQSKFRGITKVNKTAFDTKADSEAFIVSILNSLKINNITLTNSVK